MTAKTFYLVILHIIAIIAIDHYSMEQSIFAWLLVGLMALGWFAMAVSFAATYYEEK